MMKPYDSKKSVWISDDEGGFVEGLLQSDDGKKAIVMVGHEGITICHTWLLYIFVNQTFNF